MNKPYLKILSTVVLLTAFTFLALLSNAGTALAQDSNPEQDLPAEFVTVTGNGMTIVQDGWTNGSTPINKFVVTIKNENKITVNYKNPDAQLGLNVFAHNDATNGPDFSKSITRKWKNMKRDHDVYVDVSSLPGNIFYVMVGDSLPTAVKIDGSAASAPVDPCGPTSTSMIWGPYIAPESGTGELFNPSRCQWGQIQYVQDHCAEPEIFIEFTSPFPEPASVSFNGNVIYIGVLVSGEHFFNIDPASINYDDDNYVNALVGEADVSFIVGNLNPCEPPEEEPEEEPEEVPFPGCAHWEDPELVKPAMGELLIGTDSCAWGVIEFIQNPCPGSAVLRVEFESNVPERAHIYFNDVALVEGYLDSGEHVFDVTDLMDEDYNYIDAFIGDDYQAFFMLGEVDICENYSSEDETPKDEDETPKDEDETPKDEDETPKDEDETPEGPLFTTGKKETLPTTGGKHQKMLILALAITVTGTGLRCTRIG